MLKKLMIAGSLAAMLSFASSVHAQAMPTAIAKGQLQLGGGYSIATSDYGQARIQGGSAFADFDFRLHWGAEADAHIVSLITPDDIAENSYLAGPRFIYPKGRFKIYIKGLAGVGDLIIQNQAEHPGTVSGTSFAYAVGGGLDILATRHIVVRAIDAEYQHFNYLTGLTPVVFTVGAAYRF